MQWFRPVLGTLFSILCIAGPSRAGESIEPGEWETVVQVEMHGMPGAPPSQTQTSRSCIRAEDVEKYGDVEGWSQMLVDAMSEAQCSVSEKEMQGSEIRLVLDCANGAQIRLRQQLAGRSGKTSHEMIVQGRTISTAQGTMRWIAAECSAESLAR